MVRDRNYWSAQMGKMATDGENLKPQLFTLKNGKAIRSALFAYGNSIVHGTDTKGEDFKFVIGDLAEIEALKGEIMAKKKTNKAKTKGHFRKKN